MKQSEKYTEKNFGKRSDTSSHYRINCGGTKVQLMAVVEGNEPLSKCEFLMCQVGYRSEFLTAYITGKAVKLFKLADYVDWDCFGKEVQSVEMPFENYIHPDAFLEVVLHHFFSLNPQKQAV